MIKILIVEDESIAARNLERILSKVSYSTKVVAKLESVKEVISLYPKLDLDLILMDIHLLDGSAFQIFQHLNIQTPIIFTTAFDKYALQAFEYNSIQYLLKPISPQKIEDALDKYQAYSNSSDHKIDYGLIADMLNNRNYKKNFLIQVGKKLLPINTNDIAYFYVENKSIYLQNMSNKSYLLDYSLSQIESLVDPNLFYRINRQFLVGLNSVKSLYYESTTKVRLDITPPYKESVWVSLDKIVSFKRWLDQ